MAGLLIEARDAAAAARQAGQTAMDAAVLEGLVTRYRDLAAEGLTANLYRRTATAADACRLAQRFRDYEEMILRSHAPGAWMNSYDPLAETAISPHEI